MAHYQEAYLRMNNREVHEEWPNLEECSTGKLHILSFACNAKSSKLFCINVSDSVPGGFVYSPVS